MSLKSVFAAAIRKTGRIFDYLEEKHVEGQLELAKAGYLSGGVTGRYAHFIPLSPEEAQNRIKACEKRLSELRQPRPDKF